MEERKQQLLDMLKKHDITPTSGGNTRVYQVLGCHLICCPLIVRWCVFLSCAALAYHAHIWLPACIDALPVMVIGMPAQHSACMRLIVALFPAHSTIRHLRRDSSGAHATVCTCSASVWLCSSGRLLLSVLSLQL